MFEIKISKKANFFIMITLILIVLVARIVVGFKTDTEQPAPGFYEAQVLRVFQDGTLELSFLEVIPPGCQKNEIVRMIGVRVPDGNAGDVELTSIAAFVYEHLNQKMVNISFYGISRDALGRLLCFITLPDGSVFNQSVLEAGHGILETALPLSPSTLSLYQTAVAQAQEQKLGLWSLQINMDEVD